MNLPRFRASLTLDSPPPQLDLALAGLWWDAKGHWTRAHESTQQDESPRAAWVHAYLHRKEGDLANAGYWYRRAGQPAATGPLDQEWTTIAEHLLQGDEA